MRRRRNPDRWEEIREVHKSFPDFYYFITGLVGWVILVAIIAFSIFAEALFDFSMNVVTEVMGILATVILIDRLNAKRVEREQKKELIFQLGSNENISAREALRKLRFRGWLQDGSLYGAVLRNANLENADFSGADLRNVDFTGSNLKRVNFTKSNLSFAKLDKTTLDEAVIRDTILLETRAYGASFHQTNFNGDLRGLRVTNSYHGEVSKGVDMEGVDFSHTDLREVDLRSANLNNANFWGADLRGTHLVDAYLEGANFEYADMRKCNLWGATMKSANLKNAKIEDAIFRRMTGYGESDADLTNAILPDGEYFVEYEDLFYFDIDRRWEDQQTEAEFWEEHSERLLSYDD